MEKKVAPSISSNQMRETLSAAGARCLSDFV